MTGNAVINALRNVVERACVDTRFNTGKEAHFSFMKPGQQLVPMTRRRRESWEGGDLERACQACAGFPGASRVWTWPTPCV